MLNKLLPKSREHADKGRGLYNNLTCKRMVSGLRDTQVGFQHHHRTAVAAVRTHLPEHGEHNPRAAFTAGFKVLHRVWVSAMPSTGCSGQWLKMTETRLTHSLLSVTSAHKLPTILPKLPLTIDILRCFQPTSSSSLLYFGQNCNVIWFFSFTLTAPCPFSYTNISSNKIFVHLVPCWQMLLEDPDWPPWASVPSCVNGTFSIGL